MEKRQLPQAPEAKPMPLTAQDKEKLAALTGLDSVSEHMSVEKFLHYVAESVAGRPADWKDIFGEKLEELQPVIDACTLFISKLVGNDIKGDGISKEIARLGVPTEHQGTLREVVIVHYLSIQKALTLQASTISKAYLKDFDWQVKLVMASDKISYSREPILRLTLTLVKDDQTTKDVVLELSKDEVGNFISSLNAANKVVKELKV